MLPNRGNCLFCAARCGQKWRPICLNAISCCQMYVDFHVRPTAALKIVSRAWLTFNLTRTKNVLFRNSIEEIIFYFVFKMFNKKKKKNVAQHLFYKNQFRRVTTRCKCARQTFLRVAQVILLPPKKKKKTDLIIARDFAWTRSDNILEN